MAYNRFRQTILDNSTAMIYNDAINEWDYLGELKTETPDNCICGHVIRKIIYIKNNTNGKELKVGAHCINKIGECDHIKQTWKIKTSRKYLKIMGELDLIIRNRSK